LGERRQEDIGPPTDVLVVRPFRHTPLGLPPQEVLTTLSNKMY
jgi:hypothetical protein